MRNSIKAPLVPFTAKNRYLEQIACFQSILIKVHALNIDQKVTCHLELESFLDISKFL